MNENGELLNFAENKMKKRMWYVQKLYKNVWYIVRGSLSQQRESKTRTIDFINFIHISFMTYGT